MDNQEQPYKENQQAFLNYVSEIQGKRMSEVAIRKAIKKYDVRNSKIDNVTPLRAKKIYTTLLSKYSQGCDNGKNWLENERRLFIWCMICFLYKNGKQIHQLKQDDFQFFLTLFPGKDPNLLKFQTFSLIKKNNKSGSWSEEQDHILTKIVNNHSIQSKQWSQISKEFFQSSNELFFRNSKQCRQRWYNHLDPSKVKGKWTTQQDKALLSWVLHHGKKWSQIVPVLEGKKNQHMIKNRFKSLLHKKEKSLTAKNIKENQLISMILKDIDNSPENGLEPQQELEMENDSSQSSSKPKQEDFRKCLRSRKSQKNAQKNQIKDSISNDSVNKKSNKLIVEPKSQWDKFVKESSSNKDKKEYEIEGEPNDDIVEEIEDDLNKKGENEYYEKLFHSVNTPVADSRFPPQIILDARSPANFLVSPYQNAWTPTIFLFDDPQRQTSPQINFGNNFDSKIKSDFHKFIGENTDKKQ